MTAQEIAEQGAILRVVAGSQLWGTQVSESSDRDELGVCIEPPEYVVGLRRFEQYVGRTKAEGERSGAGDLDVTIYGLRKFVSLALGGNPTIIALLYAPESACLVRTPAGITLQALAPEIVSRRCGAAFLGYMQQQRQRLTGERGQKNVQRPELVEEHGFDTKYAGHVVRLGLQGVELLREGGMTLPMREPDRSTVLAVRRGEVTLPEVLSIAENLERQITRMLTGVAPCALPREPKREVVEAVMIVEYRHAWGWRSR